MSQPHPSLSRLAPVILAAALAACSRAPAEPEKTASSSAPTPVVAPLLWDAPGSWTKLEAPKSGPKKASYRIDKVGNDKEEAEMTAYFFGTGAKGDPAPTFKEWFGQFDGDVGATAKREDFSVRELKVETVEVAGTFKIALTPPARGRKQPPVQMVKNNWRLYGAVVKTPDRGNWFFKLVGPDETVQSAKSAFRAMLETLH
ncbi:MAG: hypothetical protein QM820_44805 [Minicystis sp.]